MIKYFAVENFGSIKDKVSMDFDLNLAKEAIFPAHPIIGIAGANASGKTTVLQALTFTLWFMQDSFRKISQNENIPFESFCTSKNQLTKLHLIFVQRTEIEHTTKWTEYEYEVSLTQEKVFYEALYYSPKGRRREVYIRDGMSVKLGSTITKPMNDIKAFTKDLRHNCSIVSYAAQYASQEIAIICQNYEYWSNVSANGLHEIEFNPEIIKELLNNKISQNQFIDFLRIADMGIEDVDIQKLDGTSPKEAISNTSSEQQKELINKLKTISQLSAHKIIFKHNIDNSLMGFSPHQESAGTQKFLAILPHILTVLQQGLPIIIDEIELKLHQNLVAYLIGLFENKAENQYGAQLIFSFHNTAFMKILKPEQLWFTEKIDQGQTQVFSAADFNDISKLHERNLEELYRVGRFGAKPRGI